MNMIQYRMIHVNLNFKKHQIIKTLHIWNEDEIWWELMYQIKPSNLTFSKIIKKPLQPNSVIIFNLLFYLEETKDDEITLDNFNIFYNTVSEYFLDKFSDEEILILWIRNKLAYLNPIELKPILMKWKIDSSFMDTYVDKVKRLNDTIDDEVNWLKKKHVALKIIEDQFISMQDSVGDITINVNKKTIAYEYPTNYHSLAYYFDHIVLSPQWDIALFKNFVSIFEWKNIDREMLQSFINNNAIENADTTENTLWIVNSQSSEYFMISEGHITADIKPFESISEIEQHLLQIFPNNNEIMTQLIHFRVIYLSGSFSISMDNVFNKWLLQDVILNDDMVSSFFVVNELEKANKFTRSTLHVLIDKKIPITFNSEKKSIEVIFSKCSSESDTHRVFLLCKLLINRYTKLFDSYLALYSTLLSKSEFNRFFNNPDTVVTELEVMDSSNFALKYKSLLRKTGYKTACRPKSRIPILISENEAKEKNPLEVIRYPRDNSDFKNDLKIDKQYFTCTDPNFKFPGISSLGSGSLYIPCCFNKNPRSSKAFLEYYFDQYEEASSTTTSTDHIKSDNQIIKKTGDLGYVYPIISDMLNTLFPNQSMFRVGVPDKYDSLLYCISFLLSIDLNTLKQQFSLKSNELPYMINNLKKNENYIDPISCRYLLEYITSTNIVIFTKGKNRDDPIDLLNPCFENHTTYYHFDASKPVIFILEHWGSSPDRYTKRKFPICEPIVFSSFNLSPTITAKMMTMTTANCKLLNQIYMYRYLYSNQSFQSSLSELSFNFKNVFYQIFDNKNRLRGIIFSSKQKFVYMECHPPLPPLPLIQQNIPKDVTFYKFASQQELYEWLESIRIRKPMISKIIFYKDQRDAWASLFLTNGINFTLKTQLLKGVDYKNSNVNLTPFDPHEKSSKYVKEKLARMFMDYALYLYRNHSNDSHLKDFMKKHVKISPTKLNEIQLNEMIDGNPEIMSDDILKIPSEKVWNKLYFFLEYMEKYKMTLSHDVRFLPNFYKYMWDFEAFENGMIWDKTLFLKTIDANQNLAVCYDTRSLSLWDTTTHPISGMWYYKDEIPNSKNKWEPVPFHKVDSVSHAISITWLWKTTGRFSKMSEIPNMENVSLYNFNKKTRKWELSSTSSTDILSVFVLLSESNSCYVFLF